jgi:hypothetical protein
MRSDFPTAARACVREKHRTRPLPWKSPHTQKFGYFLVARREGLKVTNKHVYRVFKAFGLLQKKRVREAALYQAARLCELLPAAANALWQADVTYLHIRARAGGTRSP